jgi:hypothetical protein
MFSIAFCLPAQAEILIFKTTISGQQFDVENNITEKKSECGYLVIDAELANPDSIIINEAYHLHYEMKMKVKIQYTTILDPENMELILVNNGKSKTMVLRWFDDPTGTYTVVYGTATVKDIGDIKQYTASSSSGSIVWREQDFRTGSGSIKLKLDIKATQIANLQNKPATQVIDEYEEMLIAKGYTIDYPND